MVKGILISLNFIILISSILAGFILLLYAIKLKSLKTINVDLKRNNGLLLSELDHRLKCVMQQLVSLTNMLRRRVAKGEMSSDAALSRLDDWLQSFSVVYRELTHRESNSTISASNLFDALTSNLFKKFRTPLAVTINTGRISLDVKNVEALSLIIHEICAHNLPNNPSAFNLQLDEQNGHQRLIVHILFRGRQNLPEEKNTFSYDIIEMMSQQLNAKFSSSRKSSKMTYDVRYQLYH